LTGAHSNPIVFIIPGCLYKSTVLLLLPYLPFFAYRCDWMYFNLDTSNDWFGVFKSQQPTTQSQLFDVLQTVALSEAASLAVRTMSELYLAACLGD